MAGQTSTSGLPSPFLDLPVEIRLEIYRYLIVYGRHHEIQYSFKLHNSGNLYCPPLHLKILRVCRQVYTESSTIFYGNLTFVMLFLTNLQEMTNLFLPRIGPKNASLIRYLDVSHVVFEASSSQNHLDRFIEELLLVLDKCTGLVAVHIKSEGYICVSEDYLHTTTSHAITLADSLLCANDHPTLRRLVQYESRARSVGGLPKARRWALTSVDNHSGRWMVDCRQVSFPALIFCKKLSQHIEFDAHASKKEVLKEYPYQGPKSYLTRHAPTPIPAEYESDGDDERRDTDETSDGHKTENAASIHCHSTQAAGSVDGYMDDASACK